MALYLVLTMALTLFITGNKFLIIAILSAERHAPPKEMKANSKKDLLLAFSVVQTDSPRLTCNLIFSSL